MVLYYYGDAYWWQDEYNMTWWFHYGNWYGSSSAVIKW